MKESSQGRVYEGSLDVCIVVVITKPIAILRAMCEYTRCR